MTNCYGVTMLLKISRDILRMITYVTSTRSCLGRQKIGAVVGNCSANAGNKAVFEQRLAHIRENLKSPELREQFRLANEFRMKRD